MFQHSTHTAYKHTDSWWIACFRAVQMNWFCKTCLRGLCSRKALGQSLSQAPVHQSACLELGWMSSKLCVCMQSALMLLCETRSQPDLQWLAWREFHESQGLIGREWFQRSWSAHWTSGFYCAQSNCLWSSHPDSRGTIAEYLPCLLSG